MAITEPTVRAVKERRSEASIQSIERATAVLRCLNGSQYELGVGEISAQLGLHKSTVSRLLLALQREGFVERNPVSGKYHLGLGLVTLAGTVLGHLDIRRVAQGPMRALATATHETITLSVLDRDACVTVEYVPGSRSVRHIGWVGQRRPLHCTAAGKVFLAHLTSEERERLLPPVLPRFTERTITERARLEERCEKIRRKGYSVSRGEMDETLCSIAAPIHDHNGCIVGALDISGPETRLKPAKVAELVVPLQDAARQISAQLGYLSEPPRTEEKGS